MRIEYAGAEVSAAEPGESDAESDKRSGPRISPIEAAFMIIIALAFDGLQFLLLAIAVGAVLNSIVSVIAWLIFFIWLHAKGMSFTSFKGGARSLAKNPQVINMATVGIGFIPIINALPERTAGTLAIIIIEYVEYFMRRFGAPSGQAETAPAS